MPFGISSEKDVSDFCYSSLLTNCCRKGIADYSVDATLETRYSMKALSMVLKRIKDESVLKGSFLYYPDRGIQYIGNKYISCLKRLGARFA